MSLEQDCGHVDCGCDSCNCDDSEVKPPIKPKDVHKGYYSNGKGQVYVVTAICRIVTYTVICGEEPFMTQLRLAPKYKRCSRKEFVTKVTHELEEPPIVWRKKNE